MLSDNIKTVFHILSCSNTEIAKAAGCSRSYISHLLNDDRGLHPTSKAIMRLAEGIYRFAEEENMLMALCELTGEEEENRETLIPALVAWLFDTDREGLALARKMPRRRRMTENTMKQQEFGDKLDTVMNLLELTNARLAHTISVDDSLVSRWRRGLRSPRNNKSLAWLLVNALLKRSQNMNLEKQVAKLAGLPEDILQEEQGMELFGAWLFGEENISIVPMMDSFLEMITNQPELKLMSLDDTGFSYPTSNQNRYWNVDGLRQAVVRFLLNAAEQGGEIWLYSDESMTWMAGDPVFFAGWKALMAACIKRGVRIKIIHNIERNMDEMLTAIGGWIPLYISGQIEPFVCRKPPDQRFSHTFFLRPGFECIYGTGVSGTEENWYDYITDKKRLSVLTAEFDALLSFSESLVQVYIGEEKSGIFRHRLVGEKRNIHSILPGLSLATLPEEVLNGMLARSDLEEDVKNEIAGTAEKRRSELKLCLSEQVCEMVVLPEDEALFQGKVPVNLSIELMDVELFYTEEDYGLHVRGVLELLEAEPNYHLLVLPELPFSDIQIVLSDVSVSVISSKEPCFAFTFTDAYLVHAFREYFSSIKKRSHMESIDVCRMLRRYL